MVYEPEEVSEGEVGLVPATKQEAMDDASPAASRKGRPVVETCLLASTA